MRRETESERGVRGADGPHAAGSEGLRLRGLRHTYPGRQVLHGVDLDVTPGSVTFLLGASGSGKTTLLRCIAGLEPYDGTVTWNGRSLDDVPAHRRDIGLVPQDQALFPHLDVAGNVAFGLRYRGFSARRRLAEAKRWLDEVGLGDRLHDPVQALSGGQRQRVALVRTLATQPRVVLLDEPLSGLDEALRHDVGGRMAGVLRGQGVAVLWVTHDEGEAEKWGDRVVRLRDGRIDPT